MLLNYGELVCGLIKQREERRLGYPGGPPEDKEVKSMSEKVSLKRVRPWNFTEEEFRDGSATCYAQHFNLVGTRTSPANSCIFFRV